MSATRVALVTGSGKKRIGYHVALALAQQGYDLVVHYRTSAADAQQAVADFQALGCTAVAVQADVADEAAVRRMFDQLRNRFPRLDVLVNCAAIWQRRTLEQTTADDVRRHFETNVLGTFLCCRYGGLWMVNQPDGGCIINIGDWALVRPYPDYAAYFASKGAIPTLTRCFAIELARRNPKVRVNCVLPGPVMLPTDLPEGERQKAIDATLLRREGSPANVAQAVVALVDNDYVTGVALPVDGGRTIYGPV